MGSLKVWDGTAWQTASGSSGSNETWVGPSAPPYPVTLGDLWYDTDEPSPVLPGTELAYNQITNNVTINTTNPAGSNLIIEGTTRSYDGSPIIVEFYAGAINVSAGAQPVLNLWDGSTDLGYIIFSTASPYQAVYGRRRLTPTVGTHNYRAAGWLNAGTSAVLVAGPGTINQWAPAFIRVTKA